VRLRAGGLGHARGAASVRTPGPLRELRDKALTTFLRRIAVLVRALDDDPCEFPLPEGLHLAILGAPEMDAYHLLRPEQDRALSRDRLARGDQCFAVLEGGRVLHAAWSSTTLAPLPYLEADAQLLPGDVCLYDSYTEQRARGQSLSRSRDELCRRHHRAAGMRRMLTMVARENGAGLRTIAPLGYRAIGEYGLLRLGPLRRRWVVAYAADAVPLLVPRRR
jgi:hypothetical protein